MTESLTIINKAAADHRHLVALTPGDLPEVQQELADWCWQKMKALGKEYSELAENLRLATKSKWKVTGLRNAVRRTRLRIMYYRKIRAAVKAGYLIIPNLPAELIAVRVQRDAPPSKQATYPNQINTAKPEIDIAPGEGRYVDETNPHQDLSYQDRKPDGGLKTVPFARVDSYDEVIDFPMIAVKPIIIAAAQQAMALRIFDTIGVAHGSGTTSRRARRSDPIVVGQILDPRSTTYNKRWVTFFIAWWLNTEML